MTITKRKLKKLCKDNRWVICSDLETYILDYFKDEPYPYTWSEQDIYEQIRKLVVKNALSHKKEDIYSIRNPILIE